MTEEKTICNSFECAGIPRCNKCLSDYICASGPSTPDCCLAILAFHYRYEVRRAVAENRQTPTQILRLLSNDSRADVRLAVAENPSTPYDLMKSLTLDESLDLKYGLAENPNLPPQFLELLVEDDNPFVAMRAKESMTKGNLRIIEAIPVSSVACVVKRAGLQICCLEAGV